MWAWGARTRRPIQIIIILTLLMSAIWTPVSKELCGMASASEQDFPKHVKNPQLRNYAELMRN